MKILKRRFRPTGSEMWTEMLCGKCGTLFEFQMKETKMASVGIMEVCYVHCPECGEYLSTQNCHYSFKLEQSEESK